MESELNGNSLHATQVFLGEAIFYIVMIAIVIYFIRKVKYRVNMRSCPYCGEDIKETAILCRFCNSKLDGSKKVESIEEETNSFTEAREQWKKENGYDS